MLRDVRASHFQAWRRLLFVHWAVDPDSLRPRLPSGVELETFAERAYIGLIVFRVSSLQPLAHPNTPRLSFLETNVRTYVRGPDDQPGVYFFSLDAGSLLATIGARIGLGLPYVWARGTETRTAPDHVAYTLSRRSPRLHGPPPGVHARYHIGSERGPAAPGSLDHFLIERYRLLVQRGPTTWSVDVRHLPYPLHDVALEALEDTLVRASGIGGTHRPPDHVALASGVDVAIGWPRLHWRA